MTTITLNESGYSFNVEWEEFCDALANASPTAVDPRDYSDNPDDFIFVSKEYALQDPYWNDGDTDDWPEHLPLWTYRLLSSTGDE